MRAMQGSMTISMMIPRDHLHTIHSFRPSHFPMTPAFEETDRCSEFSYDSDEDAPPDPFSLTKLGEAVTLCIGGNCSLVKLAEGGYHKVDTRCMFPVEIIEPLSRFMRSTQAMNTLTSLRGWPRLHSQRTRWNRRLVK